MSLFIAILEKLGLGKPTQANPPVDAAPATPQAAPRKWLATELGCPADKMNESAQMNMWLHKTVLQKLADNGGNIPKDLL